MSFEDAVKDFHAEPSWGHPLGPGEKLKVLLGFHLGFFAAFFALLQGGKYRPDDIDDPWSLSFAYNYLHHGAAEDLTTGSIWNQAGVQYFGKIYALLLGRTMDLIGWNKTDGHLLSLLFLLIGLALWGPLLKKLGFSKALSTAFPVSALLFEPFFSTAVCSRSEPFIFMASSLAVLLFLRGWYFFSALSICLAVETHPTGIIGFFYVAALIAAYPAVRERLWSRPFWNPGKVGAGFLLGFAGYAWLHWGVIGKLPGFLLGQNSISGGESWNFLYEYFFKTKYLRHIPELAIFSAGFILFFKDGLHRSSPFLAWLSVFSIAFALLVRHPNFHYVIYCYPAFLLATLRAAEARGLLPAALAGFLLLLTPQYAIAYYMNRNFDYSSQVALVRKAVPPDSLPVVGGMDDWYSFYDREFYFNDYAINDTKLDLGKFYLIQDEAYLGLDSPMRKWIRKNYVQASEWTLAVNGRILIISSEVPYAVDRPGGSVE